MIQPGRAAQCTGPSLRFAVRRPSPKGRLIPKRFRMSSPPCGTHRSFLSTPPFRLPAYMIVDSPGQISAPRSPSTRGMQLCLRGTALMVPSFTRPGRRLPSVAARVSGETASDVGRCWLVHENLFGDRFPYFVPHCGHRGDFLRIVEGPWVALIP